MDQVAIRALEVNPMQLLVIGLALLALAICLLAYFNSRSMNNLVAVMQSQVNSNGELTRVTAQQTEALRREQVLRESQIAASKEIKDAVQTHDGQSKERSEKLMEKIDSITNLVGETVSAGTERVVEALRPLIDGVKEIRDSLETAKLESQAQQKKHAAILTAIEEKVEFVSEQFIDVIQIFGEISDEETKSVDGGGAPGSLVSAGAASGSAGDSRDGSADGRAVGAHALSDGTDRGSSGNHSVAAPGAGEGGQ